ncbi:hypothetical protein CFter6_0119 [Collimonas fungivorans]|uniref:Uncharacterized protein n=1 Tax=Collimonas fungivorans TaxID=158899 RepID=A0A127P4U5_9BURK|nr:hypothetical protein CFter6_0119 [Collimonas fungivorans]
MSLRLLARVVRLVVPWSFAGVALQGKPMNAGYLPGFIF